MENISKFSLTWNFKKDDWFIQVVFSQPDIIYDICRLKEYSSSNTSKIIYNICTLLKDYRSKLESENPTFINKKNYLELHKDDVKIQISLEDEYRLKDLIDKYKIYELMGWLHLGKNPKIFQSCIMEKQKILNEIVPMLDNTIRSVIGSKVAPDSVVDGVARNIETHQLHENCVNNAWLAIIKYLTKIDTSRVMFSVIVGLAHQSASWYKYKYLKTNKYQEKRMSDLGCIFNTADEDSDFDNNYVSKETFYDSILSKSTGTNITEQEIIDEIDDRINNDTYYFKTNSDIDSENEYDDLIADIEGENTFAYLKQNILARSYDIMSGKIKRICFDKIFAEFFNDLINGQISSYVVEKHGAILIEIMDLISINPDLVNDETKNIDVYKLFRSWMKEKIKSKLEKYNINSKNSENNQRVEELTTRENKILEYLKDHRLEVISNLLRFKQDCISNSPVNFDSDSTMEV